MSAPEPIWFDEPTPVGLGPECPECGTDAPPRFMPWDGIDAGTGEHIYEERYRCSCGFAGEEEEFDGAGVSVATHAGQTKPKCPSRPIVEPVPRRAGNPEVAGSNPAWSSGLDKTVTVPDTPASISPRNERGKVNGQDCPF